VDYRAQVAEVRRRRDELIERAAAEAREAIAQAAVERDAEILRLPLRAGPSGQSPRSLGVPRRSLLNF
jgi:hypothetical protein